MRGLLLAFLAAAFLTALPLAACGSESPEPAEAPEPQETAQEQARLAAFAEGERLVGHFQCGRCHTLEEVDAPPLSQNCLGCHQQILAGEFPGDPEDLERWQQNIRGLTYAPTLVAVGSRFRPEWIASFLLNPHDLRPDLRATMPRLAVSPEQAESIAAFLTRDAEDTATAPPSRSQVARGRRLFGEQTCRTCHGFSDSAAPERRDRLPGDIGAPAPLLDETRERFLPGRLASWIEHPQHVKPDTAMPELGLSRADAEALAAYILYAELSPRSPPPTVPVLPLLERQVRFDEVDERVFHRICRHCHADADLALGDGGPGNHGWFGFEARGLNLTNYEGLSAGLLRGGRRESAFATDESGMPRLVHALRARQLEEAGQPEEGIVGMPLGHPALSPEELQLVASWVAQGRRR